MLLPLEAPHIQYIALRAWAEEIKRLPQYLQGFIDKSKVEEIKRKTEDNKGP